MRRIQYPETIRICAAHTRPSCQHCVEKALWLTELGIIGNADPSIAIYRLFANPIRLSGPEETNEAANEWLANYKAWRLSNNL